MALAGLSTLGVLFGYGLETSKGVKPSAFKQLTRVNAIDGINIDRETIDASALEDLIEKAIAGRQSTGGTFPVTINYTPETVTEWETLINEYDEAKTSGLSVWFEVYHPQMTKAFFIVAEPPLMMPMPPFGQNELMTVDMTLTINDYKGLDTAVKPTLADATEVGA